MFKFCLGILLVLWVSTSTTPRLQSFKALGHHHCKTFDLKLLYRAASGGLAEIYGHELKEYDAYIRTYVGPDQIYREDQDDSDE